jgi:hypothetical protein
MKTDTTSLFRRALELWPGVTINRRCRWHARKKFGEYSWFAQVTDYRPVKPNHIEFKARTLPQVLSLVILAGETRDA